MRNRFAVVALTTLVFSMSSSAAEPDQNVVAEPSRLLKFVAGLPRIQAPGTAGVTFAVYRDQEGGEPLWTETQNIEFDDQGQFSVVLGAVERIPLEIFSSGEARWLGLQRIPENEQPRILLAAVPYALKAADADTLGGKPLSAFVLAEQSGQPANGNVGDRRGHPSDTAGTPGQPPLSFVTTTSGLTGPIPHVAVTTGFRLASISGNTSIGFATTGGEWRVYLKSSSDAAFDSSQEQFRLASGQLTLFGGITATAANTAVSGTATGTVGGVFGGSFVGGSTAATNYGVYASGQEFGVYGINTSADSGNGHAGVRGIGSNDIGGIGVAGSGYTGVSGSSFVAEGAGIRGFNTGAPSGNGYGGYFQGGVTAATNYGVWSIAQEYGVWGQNTSTTSGHAGVMGSGSSSNGGVGVRGVAYIGVDGDSSATANGIGVRGTNSSTSGSSQGGNFDGGSTAATNYGAYGSGQEYGLYGTSTSADGGNGEAGVRGVSSTNAGTGVSGLGLIGVKGTSNVASGTGVSGVSFAANGIGGQFQGSTTSDTDDRGVYAFADDIGVYAWAHSTTGNVNTYGVFGLSQDSAYLNYGVYGSSSDHGVWGASTAATGAALGGQASNGGDLIRMYAVSGDTEFRVTNAGNVQADGGFTTGAADLAERVDMTGTAEAGDVVEIDPDHDSRFRLSSSARSSSVVGVVSTLPGVVLGDNIVDGVEPDTRPALALAGRVPVKVSAENGQIRRGDLLVASSIPGHAMRADAAPAPGTVIGKALGVLETGTGTIPMLVLSR